VQLARVGLDLRGARLRQLGAGLVGVELDQRLARGDAVGLAHQHTGDARRGLRGELDVRGRGNAAGGDHRLPDRAALGHRDLDRRAAPGIDGEHDERENQDRREREAATRPG
jgi:hypothetical protein